MTLGVVKLSQLSSAFLLLSQSTMTDLPCRPYIPNSQDVRAHAHLRCISPCQRRRPPSLIRRRSSELSSRRSESVPNVLLVFHLSHVTHCRRENHGDADGHRHQSELDAFFIRNINIELVCFLSIFITLVLSCFSSYRASHPTCSLLMMGQGFLSHGNF